VKAKRELRKQMAMRAVAQDDETEVRARSDAASTTKTSDSVESQSKSRQAATTHAQCSSPEPFGVGAKAHWVNSAMHR
jgi:hypothetical protein